MQCPRGSFVAVALSGAALGCSASAPPKPAWVPPSPVTVTVENPGGDASDPEWAALDRLAKEPWGTRRDRSDTLLIPLVDARHWQRVRLWGYPTRTAFRFGDDHYGVLALWYQPTAGPSDPESCLQQFIDEARPAAEAWGTRILATRRVHTLQRTGASFQPMVVQVVDAGVDGLFSTKEYKGALASYPSWPGTCLIQGFAVVAGNHADLATHVRDRWVTEGATHLSWHARLVEAPTFDDR
jgi:hypothetical protein